MPEKPISPDLKAALEDIARRNVATGRVTVETAQKLHPDVTDWPEPGSVDPMVGLTDHQRELVAELRRPGSDGFAFGYLHGAVRGFFDGDTTAEQLRRRLTDIDAARDAAR